MQFVARFYQWTEKLFARHFRPSRRRGKRGVLQDAVLESMEPRLLYTGVVAGTTAIQSVNHSKNLPITTLETKFPWLKNYESGNPALFTSTGNLTTGSIHFSATTTQIASASGTASHATHVTFPSAPGVSLSSADQPLQVFTSSSTSSASTSPAFIPSASSSSTTTHASSMMASPSMAMSFRGDPNGDAEITGLSLSSSFYGKASTDNPSWAPIMQAVDLGYGNILYSVNVEGYGDSIGNLVYAVYTADDSFTTPGSYVSGGTFSLTGSTNHAFLASSGTFSLSTTCGTNDFIVMVGYDTDGDGYLDNSDVYALGAGMKIVTGANLERGMALVDVSNSNNYMVGTYVGATGGTASSYNALNVYDTGSGGSIKIQIEAKNADVPGGANYGHSDWGTGAATSTSSHWYLYLSVGSYYGVVGGFTSASDPSDPYLFTAELDNIPDGDWYIGYGTSASNPFYVAEIHVMADPGDATITGLVVSDNADPADNFVATGYLGSVFTLYPDDSASPGTAQIQINVTGYGDSTAGSLWEVWSDTSSEVDHGTFPLNQDGDLRNYDQFVGSGVSSSYPYSTTISVTASHWYTNDFYVIVGYDANHNGVLDSDEITRESIVELYKAPPTLNSLTLFNTNPSGESETNPGATQPLVVPAGAPLDLNANITTNEGSNSMVLWKNDTTGSSGDFGSSSTISLGTIPAGAAWTVEAWVDLNGNGLNDDGTGRTLQVQGQLPQTSNPGGGPSTGGDPVNYFDGSLQLNLTDLESDSSDLGWGQTRSWSSLATQDGDNANGNNWDIKQLPFLTVFENSVRIVEDGTTAMSFTNYGSGYVSDSSATDKLTHTGSGATERYIWTTPSGEVTTFYGINIVIGSAISGKFISRADPDGTSITATYASGQVSHLDSTFTVNGVTTYERFDYTFYGSTDTTTGTTNTGSFINHIEEAALERSSDGTTYTTVEKVKYTYYTGYAFTSNGNAGDLMTATIFSSNGTAIDSEYYRYYVTPTLPGYVGGIKYYLNAESYQAATAAGVNPVTASDATVAQYAYLYLEYDTSHRVTKETVAGMGNGTSGQGTFLFSYTTSTNALDYNSWAVKTVVTNPDGSTDTAYMDGFGETMLTDHSDGTSHWINYYEFDSSGRQILHANPSAVINYTDSYSDLVHFVSGNAAGLSDTSGLIELTDYYNATYANAPSVDTIDGTSGHGIAGAVAGYFEDSKVEQGETGTPIMLEMVTYYGHTDSNGAVVYETAADTIYPIANSTVSRTTNYSYVFFTGKSQIKQMTTTLPTVNATENGPGVADSSSEVFDSFGRVIWTKDADGYIDYNQYDPKTGNLVESIQDVNTSMTSSFYNLPSGWSTPSGGGLQLVTNYTTIITATGSLIEMQDPNGNLSYTLNDDADHVSMTISAASVSVNASGNGTITSILPIEVTRTKLSNGTNGTYAEALSFSGTLTMTDGVPVLPLKLSGNASLIDLNSTTGTGLTIQSLSRTLFNDAGQAVESDAYFNIDNTTYLATSANSAYTGTLNTNFYATYYGYDSYGDQDRIVSPTGTITRTVIDDEGRSVSTWVGTDDTPTSGSWSPSNTAGTDMVMVAATVYDNGGAGDGNVTSTTTYPGAGMPARETDYFHDWRDRLVAVKSAVQSTENTSDNTHMITYTVLDNLGEALSTSVYDGDGVSISYTGGVPNAPLPSLLRATSSSNYDEQGRVYQSITYSVDPSTGTIATGSSATIVSNIWYDHRGDVIASVASGGPMTKDVYDGAGRLTVTYTTDGGAVNNTSSPGTMLTSWSNANSVNNDVVLTQTEYTYDSDSNVIVTTTRERFDSNATNSTGALLNVADTTGHNARVYYSGAYYDAADRLVMTVNVGTNGGSVWSRPANATSNSRSDTVLITSYTYNAAGENDTVTDPRGIVSNTLYDNLGRETETIANYTGAAPSNASDQTTTYTYDGSGHILTITADMPSGQSDQVTQYVYGITTGQGSAIDSNDVLYQVHYPTATTGQAGTASNYTETYTYDALGEALTTTDRNGTKHTYGYDVLGRQTSDSVTIPSGNTEHIDTSVLRIETSYNTQGLVDKVTSYSSATGGSAFIVNQIQDSYNGFGQLTSQAQEHNGSVNGTTLAVTYTYSDGAHGARLTSVTDPNGTTSTVTYSYGAANGLNDVIGRLDAIVGPDGSGGTVTLESYKYLGLSTVVEFDHPQDGVNLTYVGTGPGDGGDKYVGLDRFGRVVLQNWVSGGTASVDEFAYTYDRDSNVTEMDYPLAIVIPMAHSDFDQSYAYDGLNRLISDTYFNGVYSNQDWSLDSLGNMSSVTTGGTTVNRTSNAENQLTNIGGTSLTYDDDGNLTTDENGDTLVYDAWNRVVAVKSGTLTLTSYAYDGQGWRIKETTSGTTTDLYYASTSKIVEERSGVSYNNSGTITASYVYSPAYVNDAILRDTYTSGTFNERLYFTHDANYDVTAVLNTSGTVQQRMAYSAYGQATFLAANWTSGSNTKNIANLFQGMFYDAATGYYYAGDSNGGRLYDPKTMRFNRVDTAGFINGLNRYQFVVDNPVGQRDPTGLSTETSLVQPYCVEVKGGGGGRSGSCGSGNSGGGGKVYVYGSYVEIKQYTFWTGTLISDQLQLVTRHVVHVTPDHVNDPRYAFSVYQRYARQEAEGLNENNDYASVVHGLEQALNILINVGAAATAELGGEAAGAALEAYFGTAEAGEEAAGALDAAENATSDLGDCGSTETCFLAGTEILTNHGGQAIDKIAIGQRVITRPQGLEELEQPAIDPAQHRVLHLEFYNSTTHDLIRMAYLRPLSMIEGLSRGDTVPMNILELDMEGSARVVGIEPCPPIDQGPGELVTGTLNHENMDVWKLKLQGLDAPIETTGKHPFYSEDRLEFVQVHDLARGERLRTRSGTVAVESIDRKSGTYQVYNLEIGRVHQYFVSELEVLAHNAGCCDTTYKDPQQPDYNNGATHVDHIQSRALGGTDDAENLQDLPAETNMRKGGFEGELSTYRQYLIDNGMDPEGADSVISDEIQSNGNSPPPRPMDPNVLDTLPSHI